MNLNPIRRTFAILTGLVAFAIGSDLAACAYDGPTYSNRIFAPDHLATGIYVLPPQIAAVEGSASHLPDQKKLSFCPPKSSWDANLYDWAASVGRVEKADAAFYADLHKAVYALPLAEIQQVQKAMKANQNVATKNSFLAALAKKKDIEALTYLEFAKRTEPLVAEADEWASIAEQERNIPAMKKAEVEAVSLIAGTKSANIKNRYIFQAMRLMHYRKAYKEAVAFADKHLSASPSMQVEYRSLALKAGALRWLGRPAESKRLFARIADESADLREVAIRDFDFIDLTESQEKQMIKDASAKERQNLLFMIGRSRTGYAIDLFSEMQQIEADSPMLRYLAMREMSLIEDSVLPYFTQYRSVSEKRNIFVRAWVFFSRKIGLDNRLWAQSQKLNLPDQKNRNQLFAFAQKQADSVSANQDGYWATMAAWLAFYDENFTLSESLSKKALQQKPTNFVKHRNELLNLFREMRQHRTSNPKLELSYFKEFRRLYNDNKQNDLSQNQSESGIALFQKQLARIFTNTNRPAHAILAQSALSEGLAGAKFNRDSSLLLKHNETTLKALLDLFNKKNDDLEKQLFASFHYSKDNVLDALASIQMAKEDYQEAINYYKQQSKDFEKKLVYDYVKITDPFTNPDDPDFYPGPINKWTRRQFAEQMQRLSKKNDAQSNYQMAVALYNTSWHGSYWILTRDYWSLGDDDIDAKRLSRSLELLQSATLAHKTDPELTAAILIMTLRVTRAKEWQIEDQWNQNGTAFSKKEQAIYRQLKQDYQQTDFYSRASKQCSYLQILDFYQ